MKPTMYANHFRLLQLSLPRESQLIVEAHPLTSSQKTNLQLKKKIETTVDFSSQLTLCLHNRSAEPWTGRIDHCLQHRQPDSRFFLPGFLYGSNRSESLAGRYPRLRPGTIELPHAPFWRVRSDRLSHPLACFQTDQSLFAISGSPYLVTPRSPAPEKQRTVRYTPWTPGEKGEFHSFTGFGCRCAPHSEVSYTLGYENAPVFFMSNWHGYSDSFGTDPVPITLDPGEEFHYSLEVYHLSCSQSEEIGPLLQEVYSRFHESPRRLEAPEVSVTTLAEAIATDTYLPDFHNYSTQLFLEKDASAEADSERATLRKQGVVYNASPSIAWTGGVQCATPVLMASLRLGRSEWRREAIDCIQHVVQESLNPRSGLPFDAKSMTGEWTTEGWWAEHLQQQGHSSYLVGGAIYYILKAAFCEKEWHGEDHPEWLQFCEQVIHRMVSTQSDSGRFPYLWSRETGDGIDYDGFVVFGASQRWRDG